MSVRNYAVAAALAALSAFLAPSSASSAVLQVDASGELIGALNVNVGGTFYDVQFLDGTCASLFFGCDDISDFAFNAQIQADTASQALLDQVLLDGPDGNFDTQPSLISGCEVPVGVLYCAPLTPYRLAIANGQLSAGSSELFNQPSVDFDTITFGFLPITHDTTANAFLTYARWTPSAQVPEPVSLALFGIGLAGLGFSRRKWRAGQIS